MKVKSSRTVLEWQQQHFLIWHFSTFTRIHYLKLGLIYLLQRIMWYGYRLASRGRQLGWVFLPKHAGRNYSVCDALMNNDWPAAAKVCKFIPFWYSFYAGSFIDPVLTDEVNISFQKIAFFLRFDKLTVKLSLLEPKNLASTFKNKSFRAIQSFLKGYL